MSHKIRIPIAVCCFMWPTFVAGPVHSQISQPSTVAQTQQSAIFPQQSNFANRSSNLPATATAPSDDVNPVVSDEWRWQTPLGELTVPKPGMPRLRLPPLRIQPLWARDDAESAEGGSFWSSSTEAIAGGARKVADGTRQAWQGAKQVFTFRPQGRTAERAAERPSVWQRIFAPSPPSNEPLTIQEFMKQKRIRH